MKRTISILSTLVLSSVVAAGCATQKQVDEKIAAATAKTDTKIESVAGQVEDLQEKQKQTDVKLEELSKSSADALKRAEEAGMLAKGKVVFEQTFNEDRIRFNVGSWELDDAAKVALDELAGKVKALDRAVYVEIQGYTDNRGAEGSNEMLGQQRAESVRRYLNKQHSLPLGRMSTISYGETAPVADNKTKDGRAQNRRVVIVVLE
ncbi:MAG: OmpA family protein [Thermoanaerobaculia bacterium]|jgi:outer membrane protein OmpA-like peptidoglycan-associated protein